MTDQERSSVAEQLLVVIFGMRPNDGPAGQAWVLSTATTALTRAILAIIGPKGDPSDLLRLAHEQAFQQIAAAQSKVFRDQITRPA